jgi:hypothetical protein
VYSHVAWLWGLCAVVMLEQSALAGDHDGDGVADGIDVCCETPAGITVDATGRPLGDLDGDCDVDQSDFGLFQANLTGPLPTQNALPEVCDLIDNDCNGIVDDMGETTCGLGLCARTVPVCLDGTPQVCEPGVPSLEQCNTLDDDCDGMIDEDFDLLTDPNNCGMCGHLCSSAPTVVSGCELGICGFVACVGENYDINNDWVDGCEIADTVPPGHTMQTASYLGSKSCLDSDTGVFSGRILSDSRTHLNPAVQGFDPAVGAAPDWWHVFASGGFCTNDFSVTFTVTGGSAQVCYRCTIITNTLTRSVTVTGNGSASMNGGSGAYSDDTSVFFTIEKICGLPTQEEVTYTVNFHL